MRIGIDLGGTKIEGIALAADGGTLFRERVSAPREYEDSLGAISALVERIEREVGSRGSVGIGIPGAISPTTGLVRNANSTWLNGRPLQQDLERRLEREIRLMNDANCFALSEATDGAGAGASMVFGVILGTGVGGGLVIRGECYSGPNRIAGEWGHNSLPWPRDDELPGPACYCGKRGCIETFLSGPGLVRDHERRTGDRLDTRAIVAAAAAGEPDARASLERYTDRLGRGLASVVNVLDPEVIVLGGGMSNLSGLAEAATRALARYVFSDSLTTRVLKNLHGDSSGVRGAAWLWPASG
jgi:fructokinase